MTAYLVEFCFLKVLLKNVFPKQKNFEERILWMYALIHKYGCIYIRPAVSATAFGFLSSSPPERVVWQLFT